MKIAATVAQMLVRIAGLIQIVLGVLFWTGNALTFISIHMLIGSALVLLLWSLAGIALWAGANRGLAALALIWGLVVVALGMTQNQLLPGPAHWVIQVLHLLVGLGAIGMAERLAAGIPSPEFDHSPLMQDVLESGLAWEEEVVERLLAGQLRVALGTGRLSERRFTGEQTIEMLRTARPRQFIYQATLQAPVGQ